jgi:hypothetical protein
MSTIAFTACFAVWTIFSIIGIQIQKNLGLNETEFGLLVGTPILTGSLIRLMLGIWTDHQRRVESILTPPGENRHFLPPPLPNFAPPPHRPSTASLRGSLERSHSIAIFAFFFRYFSRAIDTTTRSLRNWVRSAKNQI